MIDGYTAGPGDYTVRLTLGETSVEQPLTVRYDPRQSFDPTHLAEQQRLVASTYDMLGEFQTSLLGMRSLRDQAAAKKTIMEKAGKDDLAEAMGTVVEAVDEWEDGNIATEREFFQDVLNWPDRLFTELQFLYGTLDGAMPRVTAGMIERHTDLEGKFADAMAARDAVLAGAVADANTAFAGAGEGALAVPAMTPGE